MPYTAQQQRQIEEWFKDKTLTTILCPMCSERNWAIGEPVGSPMMQSVTQPMPTPFYVVSIPRFCQNCGYVVFFLAETMGFQPG